MGQTVHAEGSAPQPGPEGTVWNKTLGTYIDKDVAASLGPDIDPMIQKVAEMPNLTDDDYGDDGGEDADSEQQPDEAQGYSEAPSETVQFFEDTFGSDGLEVTVEELVSGNVDDALETIAASAGFDTVGAGTLVATAVQEVTPLAEGAIGEKCWGALLYAAGQTDDAKAREIVANTATGILPSSQLSAAYRDWYRGLEDA